MRCRAVWKLRSVMGRRGTFLFLIGSGKAFYGAGLLLAPDTVPQGLRPLTDVLSVAYWAWMWLLAGAATAVCAFWSVGRAYLGYYTALVPPTVWAAAYIAAMFGGYPRGGFVAGWLLMGHIGVIWWASGVPEHSVPPLPRRARRGSTP